MRKGQQRLDDLRQKTAPVAALVDQQPVEVVVELPLAPELADGLRDPRELGIDRRPGIEHRRAGVGARVAAGLDLLVGEKRGKRRDFPAVPPGTPRVRANASRILRSGPGGAAPAARLGPVPARTYRIAPSILSADFARLGDEVRAVVDAGAEFVHFDVMDNHYVPNLTIGPLVCAAIRPLTKAVIDVHLMVKPVDRIVPDFAKAGADIISFHPEASEHVDRTIQLIRDSGCRPGLVFNPATPLAWLDHTLGSIDLVLIMSVNPGFGGQKFIPGALDKLRAARRRLDELAQRTGREVLLEVDGGVKTDNIAEIARAGADTFVAGSAIFGTKDYKATIAAMRAALAAAG
jgi:ribulose-phosphate 3-epimerase